MRGMLANEAALHGPDLHWSEHASSSRSHTPSKAGLVVGPRS